MRFWFAIVAGLLTTPAVAADQFDLVCKGREKTSVLGSWKPYEQRYRVDVAAKTYCRYDCKSVESIKSVDAARIEFEASDKSEPGNVALIHYVDRSDGKWVYLFSGGSGSFESVEGACEPAPFTGLPATRF